MTRWWTSRWFIVPTLMLVVTLGWLVYVGQHNNGLIEGRIVDAKRQEAGRDTQNGSQFLDGFDGWDALLNFDATDGSAGKLR